MVFSRAFGRSSPAPAYGCRTGTFRADRNPNGGTMAQLLDPKHIATESVYRAAIDERDALLAEEPDAAGGHRIDELFAPIEDYASRRFAQASRAA
jgi:hypothetical protein